MRTARGGFAGRAPRALLLLLLIPGALTAAAAPADEDALVRIGSEIVYLKKLILEQSARAASVQGEVHRLDLEATLARRELDLASRKAGQAEADLRGLQAKTRALEESAALAGARCTRILSRLYRTRIPGTLRLLLASERPSDLTATQGYLAYFARKDLREVQSYAALIRELSASKAAQEQEVSNLVRLREAVAGRNRALDSKLAERVGTLRRLREDRESDVRNLRDLEDAAARLRSMLDGLGKEAPAQPPAGAQVVPFANLRGVLPWPHPGAVETGFGRQVNERFHTVRFNNGIDIVGALGDPVRAVHAGIVRFNDWYEGYGRMVVLEHTDRYITIYTHLADIAVARGDYVQTGAVVGRLGDTGSLTGPMLHFEIRERAQPVDPMHWLLPRRAPGRRGSPGR